MNSLAQLQTDFLEAIYDTERQTPDKILPNQRMDAAQRFKLYQDGYRLRLTEALCDTFPALHTLAGDNLFENICIGYIDKHPSQHFSIRYYGHELADWLARDETYQSTPVLSEMAHFEWQLRNAFDGPNAISLQKEHFSEFSIDDWPSLCFKFLPTYTRLQFQWNVPQLWKAIELNTAPQQPMLQNDIINWIIWRPELEIKFRSVDNIELLALFQIERQCNFTELCEALDAAGITEPAQSIAGLLNRWLEEGMIAYAGLAQ